MREHGILRRIILIYREAIHLMEEKYELNPMLINKSATIIRHFIEEYHEKLEEKFLFPRFEQAGQLVDLVTTLKTPQVAKALSAASINSFEEVPSFGKTEIPSDMVILEITPSMTIRISFTLFRPIGRIRGDLK